MRNLAGLNPPGGMPADDITYPSIDGPSVFSHPLCENTYRDAKFLGNEALPTFDAGSAQGMASREMTGKPSPPAKKK